MKKGTATPEKRNHAKLTIVVKTRSPLEAYTMLKMGHPVDQALGYYTEDYQGKDLHLMDNIEKLHLLAHFKELKAHHQTDYENQLTIINNLKNEQNNQSSRSEGN